MPKNGGVQDFYFASTASHLTYYPGEASGSNTVAQATVGRIQLIKYGDPAMNISTLRKRTIKPVVGSKTGKVILQFFEIGLESGAEIKIYNNETGVGTALHTISSSNINTYLTNNKELIFNGSVTLTFSGNTGIETEPNTYSSTVNIRYITGDNSFTTCRNRTSAVWKSFIAPNSYVNVDDLENYKRYEAPICMAFFDANKNFVKTELSFCLRNDLLAAAPGPLQDNSLGQYYFGQVSFNLRTTENYDFDANGIINSDDKLRMARIAWILQNAPTATLEDRYLAQNNIWNILKYAVTDTPFPGSLEELAKAAIPSVPAEPTFSLVNSSVGSVSVSSPATFTLNTNVSPLKLELTSGANFGTIVNGTLAGGILTVSNTAHPVTIEVVRTTSGLASLKAIYDDPSYYNVNNLLVYEPCDAYRDQDGIKHGIERFGDVQPFLGLSQNENPRPVREATAEWGFSLSGNLFHDGSGLNDNGGGRVNNTVLGGGDATGFVPANSEMFVHLYEVSSTPIYVGTKQLDNNGFYKFTSVGNGRYRVVLTNGTIDNTVVIPSSSLPDGWLNTGEVLGAPDAVGADNVVDGVNNGTNALGTIVNNANVINVNFGIQMPPVSIDYSFVIDQPNAGLKVVLNNTLVVSGSSHTSPTQLTGTDLEDVNSMTNAYNGDCSRTVIIQSPVITTNGSGTPVLYYDYDGAGGNEPVALNLGTSAGPIPIRIENYCQANLSIILGGSGYTGVSFTYSFEDKAGAVSKPTKYVIMWNSALPVILKSFTAVKSEESSLLCWTTTSETNSERFEVEHGVNGKVWNSVGIVLAGGESDKLMNYTFTHEKNAITAPVQGENMYRLKMIDSDGTYSYSRMQSVTFTEFRQLVTVYPNPATELMYLNGIAPESVKEVTLVSLTGQTVHRSAYTKSGINVRGLANGVYLLKVVKTDGTFSTNKVVVNQ